MAIITFIVLLFSLGKIFTVISVSSTNFEDYNVSEKSLKLALLLLLIDGVAELFCSVYLLTL